MTETGTEPMHLALAEARLALGRVSPNPAVGAVVVKDGRIVGQGHTQPPGGPHAEIVALRQAGGEARGATLYVTLEPCNRYGRTPPCTQAIIRAGVAEVVVPLPDPNPLVNGGGLAELGVAGVRVRLDRSAEAPAREIVEAFAWWVTTGRPLVIARYAMTLDGRVASQSGEARWISGLASRQRVHELRAQVDAILVGRGTVLQDDPSLTVRLDGYTGRQPLRVILDSEARLPESARVLAGEPGRAWVAVTGRASRKRLQRLEARGVEVLVLPSSPPGVDLARLLDRLGEAEVTSLLVEGGPTVLGSFFAAGLVQKVAVFIAPKLLGGGPSPLVGEGAWTMAEALSLERSKVEVLDGDVLVSGYVPSDWGGWRETKERETKALPSS